MRSILLLLVLGACVPAWADGEAEGKPAVDAVRVRVAALAQVDGDQVYYEGRKGEFFAAYEGLRALGGADVFRPFLDDPSPVARAMGLYGLAQVEGVGAVPGLRRFLRDRQRFAYYPYGCVGSTLTVGAWARTLLVDRDPLRHAAEHVPLADPGTLLGVELEVLAANEAAAMHHDAATALGRAIDAGRLTLGWESLRAAAPQLSRVDLVRAVGRVGRSPARASFLEQVLGDPALDAPVRLAAASALAKDGSAGAVAAIERERAFLDGLPEGRMATLLLDEVTRSEAFDARWAPLYGESTWMGMERIADEVRAAFAADQPFALERLLRARGLAIYASHADVRAIHTASLLRIAGDLGRYTQPWNAWGTAPYLLEALVAPVWKDDTRARRGRAAEDDRKLATRLAALLEPHLAP